MSAPAAPSWLCWSPNGFPGRPGRWRLIRFGTVDADGRPVGKAIEAVSAGGNTLCFRTESSAQCAANYLNREEGRCRA